MEFDPTHHIPDWVVKSLIKRITIENPEGKLFMRMRKSTITETLRPDGMWLAEPSTYLFIEYENSRGMLHHVSKYQQIAYFKPDITFKALFIESINHQQKYSWDRNLAYFQYLRSPLPNLDIQFIPCTGSIQDLTQNIVDFLSPYC